MTGYPLQSVLDLRRREEEAAMAHLANAMRGREAAEREEAARLAEVADADGRMEQARAGDDASTTAATATQTAALFVERRRDELKRARQRLAEFRAGALAEARLAEAVAREAHLAARRARETFEKHAAKHVATVRLASERRDDQALDDLAQRRPGAPPPKT